VYFVTNKFTARCLLLGDNYQNILSPTCPSKQIRLHTFKQNFHPVLRISSVESTNVTESTQEIGYFQCTNSDKRYTHKTSAFKTSDFKTSGFKTSETSGLQNVSFTKRHVVKTSGRQNVRSSKRPVAKQNIHIYSVLVVGGNPQVLLQPCL
jgi:hypothetical protein